MGEDWASGVGLVTPALSLYINRVRWATGHGLILCLQCFALRGAIVGVSLGAKGGTVRVGIDKQNHCEVVRNRRHGNRTLNIPTVGLLIRPVYPLAMNSVQILDCFALIERTRPNLHRSCVSTDRHTGY